MGSNGLLPNLVTSPGERLLPPVLLVGRLFARMFRGPAGPSYSPMQTTRRLMQLCREALRCIASYGLPEPFAATFFCLRSLAKNQQHPECRAIDELHSAEIDLELVNVRGIESWRIGIAEAVRGADIESTGQA